MTLTWDIIPSIGEPLLEQDFWSKTPDEQAEMINAELKKYLINKINQIGARVPEDIEELTATQIFQTLADAIPKEDHFEQLRHVPHYILGVASDLQGWHIEWCSNDNEKYINQPESVFYGEGEWEGKYFWKSFTSHSKTECVKDFDVIYNVFNTVFIQWLKEQDKSLKL